MEMELAAYLRDMELRRKNRRRRREQGVRTFYDVSLEAARKSNDAAALSRLESVVRSQWRFGEMVRLQLEQILPKLLETLIEDNHTDLTALYSLLYQCCAQAHTDSQALLSALNAFSDRSHGDSLALLSSLQGIAQGVSSINNLLVSHLSSMEEKLSEIAGSTGEIAGNTERPVFSVSVSPERVTVAAGTKVTFTVQASGAVASVRVSATLNGEAVPVSGNTVVYTFTSAGAFRLEAVVTDGVSTGTAFSDITVSAVVPDITVSYDLGGGTGTVPDSVTGPSPLQVTLPGFSGFSRPGYDFISWKNNIDGVARQPGDAYTALSSCVFVAQWQENLPPEPPPEPEEYTVLWQLMTTAGTTSVSCLALPDMLSDPEPVMDIEFAASETEGHVDFYSLYMKPGDGNRTFVGRYVYQSAVFTLMFNEPGWQASMIGQSSTQNTFSQTWKFTKI